MLSITVDANILHALVRPERHIHRAATALWALQAQGRLRIHPSDRWTLDIPSDPLRSRIAALLPAAVDAESTPPQAAAPATPALQGSRTYRRLRDLVFPGAVSSNPREPRRHADIVHLIDHRRTGRAVFVTDDKAILGRAGALARDFGIVVMAPAELARRIAQGEAAVGLRRKRD